MCRRRWIKEAEKAEANDSVATAQAIMTSVLDEGVEAEERKTQWMEDADNAVTNESYACARAVYAHALAAFRSDEGAVGWSACVRGACALGQTGLCPGVLAIMYA